MGDPGHDEACPSLAARHFISPSWLGVFVWVKPSVAKPEHECLTRSHEGAKGKAEVCPLLDCFSDRTSPRMESADYADGHRLVRGGSMRESASIPKSADEMDRGFVKVLRRRLISPAIWRGTLRRARIDA